MKTLLLAAIRCSLMFTAGAALSLAYPASVQAVPTTYNYSGRPFTFAIGPYSTSDFVTIMVTLADPPPPNGSFLDLTPLAFSMFDGVQTITNLNATFSSFNLRTNNHGIPFRWNVAAGGAEGEIDTSNEGGGGEIFVEDDGFINISARGLNQVMPGHWGKVPVSDAGSSLALLSLSLAALGVATRQFKEAAV